MTQLALPFVHEPAYDPAAFVPDASNHAARMWLAAAWPSGRLALWGPAGCGKTHLLHVWAEGCGGAILPGPDLAGLPVLPGGGAVAVDDADAAPEHALLHLLNSAAEDGCRVLLAARAAPSRWPTRLADLASRLRAMQAAEMVSPSDEMLAGLFAELLTQRQLAVSAPVQRWLLLRLPRDPSALRETAARLDAAALAAGRRVGHTLAVAVLAELGCAA